MIKFQLFIFMIFNFSFLSFNSTLPALANTNPEFLNSYTINFNEGSSLKDTSQTISQILASTKVELDSKTNTQTNIQLNSELETDKTILPISLTLESTNSDQDIQKKFQQAQDTQIKGLKELKSQITKTIDLNSKVAGEISLADSTASKISSDINTLNLANNIELTNLNALETSNQILTSIDKIPTVSLEVQTPQDSSVDKMILKLSNKLDSNPNNRAKKNIKLKASSDTEFNSTNQVFQNYIKEVENESQAQTDNAIKARPEFDALYQTDYTDDQLNALIKKWERKPKAINVPTYKEIITNSSLDQVSDVELSSINQLESKKANERQSREKTISGESKSQTSLDQATPTIEKVSKDRTKNNLEGFKNSKKVSTINSTVKLQVPNPNFKDTVKEKQAEQKILDDQKKQAEVHDKLNRLEEEFKKNNKQPQTESEKLEYESSRTNYLIDNDNNLTAEQKTSAKRNYKNDLKRNIQNNQKQSTSSSSSSSISNSNNSSTNSTTSSQSINNSNNSNSSSSSPIALNSSNQTNSNSWINTLANVIFGGSINAEAKGLNNSDTALSIYGWDQSNFALDIPNGNTNIGTRIAVNYNNNDNAQKWWFNNNQEIRSKLNTDRCLDIGGGNYTNGAVVQLWDCNGTGAQKFFFYGNTLRSWADPNFCVDVPSNNWTPQLIRLWDCNNSGAQKFVPGDNGFNNTFQVQIAASGVGIYSVLNKNWGHVFLSFYTNNTLNNTMSVWQKDNDPVTQTGPNIDANCDNNIPVVPKFNPNNETSNANIKRSNNMCDYDNIMVDKNQDIGLIQYKVNISGGDWVGYKDTVPKRISDIYRFGGGYRWGLPNWGRVEMKYTQEGFRYEQNSNGTWYLQTDYANCASFSTRVWDYIMDDMSKSRIRSLNNNVPVDVKDRIIFLKQQASQYL